MRPLMHGWSSPVRPWNAGRALSRSLGCAGTFLLVLMVHSCAGSNGEEYQRPDGPDDDNTEADPLAVGAAICAAGDVHDVTAEKESKEVAEDIEEDTGNNRGSLAKFSFRHDRYHEAGERRNHRAGTMHHHKEQRT